MGVVLLAFAIFGYALAALVLKADPKRVDNRLFAVIGAVDASNLAVRGVLVVNGLGPLDPSVLKASLVGSVLIAHASVVFAYSFPFDRPMPGRYVWPLRILTGAALWLSLDDSTRAWFGQISGSVYFVPHCVLTLGFAYRNYRRAQRDVGVRLMMLSLALRWASGVATYVFALPAGVEYFVVFVQIDGTVALIGSYLLCGYSILKTQLFRVRGIIADLLANGGLAIGLLGIVGLGVETAYHRIESPAAARALLIGLAFLPAGALFVVSRWRLRLEDFVLCSIDPRRAALRSVLERAVRTSAEEIDPEKGFVAAKDALLEATQGGRVEILEASALPPALRDHLARMSGFHLHKPHASQLSELARAELEQHVADIWVPIRKRGTLFGAIALSGGLLDRDVVVTAGAVAEHLGIKLENYGLFRRMLGLEKELEESRRLAALGMFAAAIAHDIRTPLTSVQMNVQILRGKSKLSPDDLEHFDIALVELKRLNSHVGQLLDYAKPAALHPIPIDLRDLAEDAIRGVDAIVRDRSLRLLCEHAAELPLVLADAPRIRQVLVNLLENASQASSEGSLITLKTALADEGRIMVEVRDDGRGIKPEDLPRIFEPFFTTRADGTGLGLAIAKKLVRAHGGDIVVESEEGRGSTFRVFLPAASA